MESNLNCFSLMNNACKKLKGKFGKAFLATLIVVAPIVAISFIPYYVGIILAVLISGYLFYGLVEYFKRLFNDENPSLKVIFTNYNKMGAATLMGIINVSAMLLGFVLLIFPAIVYMIYYGVNLHVLADQKETKVLEAFNENSTRMVNNKTLVLSYKILNYFLMAVTTTFLALLFIPISVLYSSNMALGIFLGFLVVIAIILVLSLIGVLYEATQTEFYLNNLTSYEDAKRFIEEKNQKTIEKRNIKLELKKLRNEESSKHENCECHKEECEHKKENCEHKKENCEHKKEECPHCKCKEENKDQK